MYGSQWGSLAAVCSLYKVVFYVTRIRIRYYKSCALRLNEICMIKIIIARKISLIFVAIGIVTHAAHHENTDGNKLVIFSGMYYGDDYVTVCM